MKRSLILTVFTIVLFTGCTEENKKTETKDAIEQVKQEATQVVEQKIDVIKAEVSKTEDKKEEPKIEDVKETLPLIKDDSVVVTVDGEALFKTCASCHGAKGEKEALGKSQAIAGWDKDRVIKALNGYKDGSYGGVMKGLMKPHVETKTTEEIDALADFISKL